MATKAAAKAAAIAEPKAGQPISAYRVVWVTKQGVPLAGGRTGYVRVLKQAAQQMIDNGDAQDPYGKVPLKNIKSANTYTPPTPPSTVNVAVTAISPANPAVATLSQADVTKLTGIAAAFITLSGATGDAAAVINAKHAFVKLSATTLQLTALDNSAPLVFAGFPLAGVGSKT